MAYKRHLFETGGYQAYEYARTTDNSTADDEKFAVIHNNLRAAAAVIVGVTTGAMATLRAGASTIATESGGTDNLAAVNQLTGGGYDAEDDSPVQVATRFVRNPFVGVRKDGADSLVMQAKTFDTKLIINPFDTEQEKLLSTLFPGYKHPTEFANDTRTRRAQPVFSSSDNISSHVDQATLMRLLKGQFAPYVPKYISASAEFESAKPLPKGMGVSLRLRLDTDPVSTNIAGIPYSMGLSSGGAMPSTAAIKVTVHVTPELHLPLDYAYWAMYCESKEEFVPFMFMTHLNSIVQAAGGVAADKGIPSFLQDLDKRKSNKWKRTKARKPTPLAMQRRNLEKEKILGFTPKVSTNSDGYLITAKNIIFKLPTDGQMSEYQAASNTWFESLSEEDTEALAENVKGAPKFKFPPAVLYVDNHNEVMVYTTQEGAVTSYNLRGARALDSITIANRYGEAFASVVNGGAFDWFDERLNALGKEGRIVLDLYKQLSAQRSGGGPAAAHALAAGAAIPPSAVNPIRTTFEDEQWYALLYTVRNIYGYNTDKTLAFSNTVDKIINGTPDEKNTAENEAIALLNRGAQKLADVTRKVWATQAPREEGGGVLNNLQADACAYIVAQHTEALGTYSTERLQNSRNNIVDGLDRDRPIAVPNIDTSRMKFVFPHQAEFIQSVDREVPPKYGVIGAAPGGGKTNMILADILLLLSRGLIKRPVVTVPNQLVRQFVAEINEYTNGKINAFPFTWQHMKDVLMNPLGFNMDTKEVIEYLRGLPKNTIIITNYNTLRNGFTDNPDSYAEVGSYDNYGEAGTLKAYPFVDILSAAGMDYICGDESHKIKNADSDLAKAFLTLCAKAEYVRLSSGTTINNVVTDLVGQTQKINPAILGGDIEEFAENFLGDSKARQVSTPAQADAIADAMREYSLVMQRDSRSWDYMLPKMQEMYHRVALTDLQTRYYKVLFSKAINKIQEDAKTDLDKTDNGDDDQATNAKVERIVQKHFSVIDRFVNDPEQFTDFVDGSFVYDEKMMQNEQAGILGDYPEPGSLQLEPAGKMDLISVKAVFAYDLLYAHMGERGKLQEVQKGAPRFRADPTNKVIIMAPNKFVGNHVWNNMPKDLKSRAVRYQAGAFDKVEQFKTDDDIKFMIADEISISEGHNLQVGSRIIRMQQVWTPGGETQSLARIRRPDPFGKYNRDALGYDIIVATQPSGKPTIDDLRIARLLSKKFNNAMVEFGYEPSFRNEFFKGDVEPLPPVRMSMDVIKSFPEEMLEKYFDQQQRFNGWFARSSADITKKIGREVESITGKKLLDESGRPLNVKDFVAAVVIPTVQAPDMDGSAQCYVPWLPGVQPINPLEFDMQPIRSLTASSIDEDDEDGDDGEDEDQNPDNVEINIGDHVMTEFGPGIVANNVRMGIKLDVWIPSMKSDNKKDKYKKVRLPKTCIYVPLDDDGAKKLATAITGKAGTPTRGPKSKDVTPDQRQKARDRKRGADKPEPDFTDYDNDSDFEDDDFDLEDLDIEDDDDDELDDPITTLIEDEEDDLEDEESDEDEEPQATISAQALAINGELAIAVEDLQTENGLDILFTKYGFKKFPDMVRIGFKTHKALDTFLAKLQKAKFVIPRNNMAEIETIALGLSQRGKLHQLHPYNFSLISNFMKTEQKKVPKRPDSSTPQTFRLYPIVMRGNFYLCASATKHPFNVNQALTRLMVGTPGIMKPQKFDNMGVKFYPNMSAAKSDAKKLIAAGNILEDPQDLLDTFDEIQSGHIEMPAIPKPKAVIKPKAEETRPIKKPGVRITPKAEPEQTQWDEETHNPAVDDIEEFYDFLREKRATITYIRGNSTDFSDVKNVPLRVRRVSPSNIDFAVSPYKDAPKEDYIKIHMPDDATFDATRGIMKTPGGSVFRLSYAGE